MSTRAMGITALVLGACFALTNLAHAANPDTTATEPLRRPRPTASAPT